MRPLTGRGLSDPFLTGSAAWALVLAVIVALLVREIPDSARVSIIVEKYPSSHDKVPKNTIISPK